MRHAFNNGLIKPTPKGHGRTPKGKDNIRSKPVVQINERGEIVARYDCQADADRALGLSRGMVCRAVRGVIRTTAGGYEWRYESDIRV